MVFVLSGLFACCCFDWFVCFAGCRVLFFVIQMMSCLLYVSVLVVFVACCCSVLCVLNMLLFCFDLVYVCCFGMLFALLLLIVLYSFRVFL